MSAQADDVTELWLLARRTAASLERIAEAELQSELGLSLSLFALLSTLDAHDCHVNQQEAADLLGLTKSSVSRQVEAAVAAGLLEQGAQTPSRREKVQQLTPAGREILGRAYGILGALAPRSSAARASAAIALTEVLETLEQ
jgi:DNA-binding MarR family transcriptional regulator